MQTRARSRVSLSLPSGGKADPQVSRRLGFLLRVRLEGNRPKRQQKPRSTRKIDAEQSERYDLAVFEETAQGSRWVFFSVPNMRA